MNYIIVDDEVAAHSNLENFARELPYLTKLANCYHAFEALDVLKTQKVELVFLDINMPKLSGFDLLKSLHYPPDIIVTTAYEEYALEGYELDVVDYLLKPFSFNRFLRAVNKVKDSTSSSAQNQILNQPNEASIFIKSNKKHHKVFLKDILFVEAQGNYVKIQTKEKRLMSYMSLTAIERLLPSNRFVRVHKSFIISTNKLTTLEGNRIIIDQYEIPIGQNYRKYVLSKLGLLS